MEEQALRNEMYREIKGHNKHLSVSYLNTLTTAGVVANTHPLYRARWQFECERAGYL